MTTTTDNQEQVRKLAAADARRCWKEMCAHLHAMEQRILQLMMHPDTTQEQVMAGRDLYMRTVASMKDTLLKLQERYPRSGRLWDPAWEFESLSGQWYVVRKK